MPTKSIRILSYITIPAIATGYGIHLGLNHLEEKYPARPLAAGSTALSTSSRISQRCAYTDIYAARIRLEALESRIPETELAKDRKVALEEAWARAVLSSRPLRTEASILGLFRTGKYAPGDLGQDGFATDSQTGTPRTLLQGLFVVEKEPVQQDSNGLLVSWSMADGPRLFFEKIARWGYPWRLMSGGRHEMSVSEPFEVKGEGKFVEVRFSAAHDYEIIPEEKGKQKIMPEWTNRLHRGYARFVLDSAAREVEFGL
ncbi:uncharacterized protein N7469_005611 [Penicillium citrinum]|uniref:Uncharacterized protein n=2 Tax=Penicillium TaxID=5073 RepID=A0A9W9TP86_PENCI|nr:uncharacterized protein N7469_005611 [Penicillium citrinum]KAJ5233845.1 hypothetical protein N7469_005611 [Penicillium citrinum]KAJ5572688.1 hypothetical protein N7450_009672 [Penicillium hetheringtonii]KAK5790166.1 hypothetical protein VI817_007453 [Penicillium citrinum]